MAYESDESPADRAPDDRDGADDARDEVNRGASESRRSGAVAESIRYRRRAQAAEAEAQQLRSRLESLQGESDCAATRISELENRLELERHLARAGAIDVDAVRLLAEESLRKSGETEITKLIEDLRRRRPHLFDSELSCERAHGAGGSFPGGTTAMAPSAGHESTKARRVRAAATQARLSGDGGDLMQYMRVRRNAARGGRRSDP